MKKVIIGATMLDGLGGPPVPNAVIVVDGDTIAHAGPEGTVPRPPGSEIVDLGGMFVLPVSSTRTCTSRGDGPSPTRSTSSSARACGQPGPLPISGGSSRPASPPSASAAATPPCP